MHCPGTAASDTTYIPESNIDWDRVVPLESVPDETGGCSPSLFRRRDVGTTGDTRGSVPQSRCA